MTIEIVSLYIVKVIEEFYITADSFTKYFLDMDGAQRYSDDLLSRTIYKIPLFVFIENSNAIKDGDTIFALSVQPMELQTEFNEI